MENIIQTAEQLLNRKLTANDGYTSEEIKQAENILGLTMPESLKLFYSLVGKVGGLDKVRGGRRGDPASATLQGAGERDCPPLRRLHYGRDL